MGHVNRVVLLFLNNSFDDSFNDDHTNKAILCILFTSFQILMTVEFGIVQKEEGGGSRDTNMFLVLVMFH